MPEAVPYIFWGMNDALRTVGARGTINGLGAHTGLRYGDGGPRAAGAERILAAENRILKAQLKGRLKFSDAERASLGEIGNRLGRKALAEVATIARPDTVLAGDALLHVVLTLALR